MPRVLVNWYRKVPIPKPWRESIKRFTPYALRQPNRALRQFGTVQELYPCRIDRDIDTHLYIQNYFSVFYPNEETATEVVGWLYDSNGQSIHQFSKSIGKMQTLHVSVTHLLKEIRSSVQCGTLMWHIVLPAAIAARKECQEQHGYFTDRGYLAFVKKGAQATFFHGIDRYAVFQRREREQFDLYYRTSSDYIWAPEIPFGQMLGCETVDVMSVNRSHVVKNFELILFDQNNRKLKHMNQLVQPRGLFLQSIHRPFLEQLKDGGSIQVRGLPTQWSRVLILRHFAAGSISAMHC